MAIQRYTCLWFFTILLTYGYSQNQDHTPRTISELPKVFLIGEYESLYQSLYEHYPGFLLSQTENDMDAAFEKWLHMVYSMEDHSQKIEYNLKGLKVWIHVFFNKSGEIDHIMFHKKPQSKNIDDKELIAFFRTFIRDFKLPIDARENFNHSGSASFPTYGNSPLEANHNKEK